MESRMNAETFFMGLYGNDRLKSYLLTAVGEKKLPHALIFEGAEGSGKMTAVISTLSAMEPQFSEKIASGGTPDVTVITIPDGKKSIGVTAVRDIKYQAYIKPQELSCRAFIIDKAETMTPEAQNALLKIFEEPPANVFFFLLCDNASSLLSTVRSRAPVLRMEIFDGATLSDYLIDRSIEGISVDTIKCVLYLFGIKHKHLCENIRIANYIICHLNSLKGGKLCPYYLT